MNVTDNWQHPSRGPRLPEIEPGDESRPCEGCHGSAKAHKEAVRARMLTEAAEQVAVETRRHAAAARMRGVLSGVNADSEVARHFVERVRSACHGAPHIEENVLSVLRDAGLVL
jgi:hypothetical protein